MDNLANIQKAKIEQIQFRRREAAAKVRSLLEQLEIAERDFEIASRELLQAESEANESAA